MVHRTEDLRRLEISTASFAFQAEILLKLLAMGKTYVEVPIRIAPSSHRRSKAFRPKNVLAVAAAMARLAREVGALRRARG